MRQSPPASTRGILRPEQGLRRFDLDRQDPPADLEPFVALIWSVRWDLPDGQEYVQETLPYPCAHLVFEEGEYRVHGPGTQRFEARLRGSAWVVGFRFRPAGLAPFSRVPMRDLVDRVLPAPDVLGCPAPPPARSIEEARTTMLDLLRDRVRPPSAELLVANRVVGLAEENPAETSAAGLARAAGCSVRSLHRLLERQVGVGTKWIVRRARVQAAAERVARGESVDWSDLAHELGYADQAHLIREFREQVGVPPAAYARGAGPEGDAQASDRAGRR